MSDTGTIAHSVVEHLPLTAIHQRTLCLAGCLPQG